VTVQARGRGSSLASARVARKGWKPLRQIEPNARCMAQKDEIYVFLFRLQFLRFQNTSPYANTLLIHHVVNIISPTLSFLWDKRVKLSP
jgi:hypothetical protein